MYKQMIVFSIVARLIAGCAAPRQLTRQEWIGTTTKIYQGVSQDQILLAAEELFRLADGKDFQFVHSEDELYATRNWLIYLVFAAGSGTDYWKVSTSEKGDYVKVAIQVNTQMQTTTATATTGGYWTTTTTPMAGFPVQGTAIYDVFWARMDYLLGKRRDWMDCGQADRRVAQDITWGSNEALCNSFNVIDARPS